MTTTLQGRLMCALVLCCALAGCRRAAQPIRIEGSSSVYPLTDAVLAAQRREGREVSAAIQISGTGGGFEALCAGRADIIGASRPIGAAEIERCARHGVEFLELPVAFDGIAIVAHPSASWVEHVSVEELRRLFAASAQGRVKTWSQVRPGWPSAPIHLYGPGARSGTTDHLVEAVLGRGAQIRRDYTSNEDDHVLITAVSRDPQALGFFSYVYWREHRAKLKLLGVQQGQGAPVKPSNEHIQRGEYGALARPLFLYVARASSARADVDALVTGYLEALPALVTRAGYLSLGDRAYGLVLRRWKARRVGSVFHGQDTRQVRELTARLEQAAGGE